jgi:hypothetical protein
MATSTRPPAHALVNQGQIPAQTVATPTYTQATIAAAAFGRHVITERGRLESCVVVPGNAGAAGNTVLRFRRIRNGTAVDLGAGTTTIANTATDGQPIVVPIGADLEAGDVIDCNVTTAPTSGADLSYSPVISRIYNY